MLSHLSLQAFFIFTNVVVTPTELSPKFAARDLVGASISGTTINLEWQDVNITELNNFNYEETSYKIERALPSSSNFVEIAEIPGGKMYYSYRDIGHPSPSGSSATFRYRVRPANGGNLGPYSQTASIVAGTVTIPPTPKNVEVFGADNSKILVTWADVGINEGTDSGSNGFEIEVTDVFGGPPIRHELSPSTVRIGRQYISNLTPGQKIWIRVRASNIAGKSAYSSHVSLFVPEVGLPVSPTNVRSVSEKMREASILWNAVSGATSYVVEETGDSTFYDGVYWNPVLAFAGTTNEFKHKIGINAYREVRVRTQNAVGLSAPSEVIPLLSMHMPAPDSPEALRGEVVFALPPDPSVNYPGRKAVELTWNPKDTQAEHWIVQRALISGNSTNWNNEHYWLPPTGTLTNYVWRDFPKYDEGETNLLYRVKNANAARNPANESKPSNEIHIDISNDDQKK